MVIEIRKDATYSRFTECLWRAVGVRLLVETLEKLRNGYTFQYGDIKVSDGAVMLQRSKFFGKGDWEPLPWSAVSSWSHSGSLWVASRTDKKLSGSSSYITDWNTQIVEHIVRNALDKGAGKLSNMLKA